MKVDDFSVDWLLNYLQDDGLMNIEQAISEKLQIPPDGSESDSSQKISSGQTSPRGSRCGRPANPIPRHKRESHINAEIRRRNKIKSGFEMLKKLVPAVGEISAAKDSESATLFKTAEHCRQLKSDCKRHQEEACSLRKEIEALGTDIHKLQKKLPASGMPVVERPSGQIDKMYEDYVKSETKRNWKFWIFSFVMKPLFTSFSKMVSSDTLSEFMSSVFRWSEEHLTLVAMRPAVLSALCQISKKTSVLTSPDKLPEEALQSIGEPIVISEGACGGPPSQPPSRQPSPDIVASKSPIIPDLSILHSSRSNSLTCQSRESQNNFESGPEPMDNSGCRLPGFQTSLSDIHQIPQPMSLDQILDDTLPVITETMSILSSSDSILTDQLPIITQADLSLVSSDFNPLNNSSTFS
ncbi:hypothetical protein ScPMuIL_012504 [Solemya velum]